MSYTNTTVPTTYDPLKEAAKQAATSTIRTFINMPLVRSLVSKVLGEAREMLNKITQMTTNQAEKFVKQMLFLKWLMGLKYGIGTFFTSTFNTPELLPIKIIADTIGCVELSLQGNNQKEITIGIIYYNRTSSYVKNILGDTNQSLSIIVSKIDYIINSTLDSIENGSFAPNINNEFASIYNDLINIRNTVIRNSSAIIGPGVECMPNLIASNTSMPNLTSSIGGKAQAQHLVWHNREYVVRTDKDGKRYIMSKRARLYLSAIRGQYRYKK